MAHDFETDKLESSTSPSEHQNHPPTSSEAKYYEIHVQGHLDSKWSEWLEGFEVRLVENGEMILSGLVVDQSALLGVLNKLSRLNLTLLSINEMKNINKKESL